MAMKNPKTKRFDWSQVLRDEARITDVLLTEELATKLNLSTGSVSKALSRLEKRGLMNRVADVVYLNKLVRDHSATGFISVLKADSYVSLELALSHWGWSRLTPVTFTCLTKARPR